MTFPKTPLTLAVAGASLLLVDPVLAADITVDNSGDGCETNLRGALDNVLLLPVDGDKVVIDPLSCPEIVVTESSIVVQDKPFILSAPLDAMGVPQVTIKAASGTTFGLFTLEDTANPTDPNFAIPVIFSGIRFADATNQGPGGAINAQNHGVILHNSIVTNNTAVGSGGGVSVNGELLILGSEISNNTVTEVISDVGAGQAGSASAVGGGVAVHGQVFVGPGGAGAIDIGNSLANVSAEFAAAAAALDPEGEELIPSVISGNKAEVSTDVGSDYNQLSAVAAGGGIALFPDGASRTNSLFNSNGGGCYISGPFDSAEALGCNRIYASSLTGNTAELTLTGAGTTELKYVYAGGGGAALMTEGDVGGSLLATKYSSVDENMVVMSLPETKSAEVALAGGGGQWVGSLPYARDLIPLWDSIESQGGGGKYSVWAAGSSISGNSVTVDGVGNEGIAAIIGGGGLSNAWFDPEVRYGAAAIFSTVSGNTVDVNADEAGSGVVFARGGGLDTIKYASDAGDWPEIFPGIAATFASSVSGNTLDVDGVTYGSIGGGGVSAGYHIGLFAKPQFTITDPDAFQEAKYGPLLAPVEVWGDPGGIVNNTVNITTAPNPILAASGGGLLAGNQYSYSALLGTSVSGNLLSVTAPASGSGFVSAVGGGVGTQPGLGTSVVVAQFSATAFSAVDDNSVMVTAPDEVEVDARGGGIGSKASFGEIRPNPFDEFGNFQTLASTISGNSIEVTGGSALSRVSGGGIAVDTASSDETWQYSLPDVAALSTSTIANNSIELTGSGTAAGAGVFAEIKYDADFPFVMNFMTVVGNTSSVGGVPTGGQVWLQEDPFSNPSVFIIINSLISGDVAQGTQDVYYQDDLIYGYGTAVYHGASSPHPDFLAPAVADPAYLGDLQYNGGQNELGSKYGFGSDNKTIALLAGSGAINPQKEGACATSDPYSGIAQGVDQRLFSRDACPDTGAYERGAEGDGDGLVDGTELVVPGTDPSLAPTRQFTSAAGIEPVLVPTGDGNSDGIYDLNQGQVASFEYGGQVVTLATYEEVEGPGGVTFIGTGSRFAVEGDGPAVAGVPGLGQIVVNGGAFFTRYGFTFTADTPDGEVENFELILPRAGNENAVLVKSACNEELPGSLGDWEVVGGAESFGSDRIRLTFSIEEGGRFDCNGSGNGILDPVFVATPTEPTPVPTLPWFLVWVTAGLSALAGLARLRRRS